MLINGRSGGFTGALLNPRVQKAKQALNGER
jgi:hypothetical protein